MFTQLALLLSIVTNNPSLPGSSNVPIATHSISLETRYSDNFVNSVFKDNILLTLDYMSYEFSLNPGETFAFHDKIDPKYNLNIVKTTNAHFNYKEGFKSDGYLIGDGICHLASLIYWVAKDAGIEAISPINHDFAVIPEIPKEYGVSIYSTDPRQNLYITNTLDKPVTFRFEHEGENLKVNVLK